jgi:phage terminase small subunit
MIPLTLESGRIGALTSRQSRFVEEYLVDLNATQAAIRAGYSAKTAHSAGPRLLENVEVARAVRAGMDARAERARITADDVIATIEETVRRCSQAEPVRDARGNVIEGEYTFDAKNVLRGCELLGRHLGLFKERPEVSQTFAITRTIVHVHRHEAPPNPTDLSGE